MLMHHNHNEFLADFFPSVPSIYVPTTHAVILTPLADGADIMDELFLLSMQLSISRFTILPRNFFMNSDKQGLDPSDWYHVFKLLFLFLKMSLLSSYKIGEHKL